MSFPRMLDKEKTMKCLIVANTIRTVLNFRLPLIRWLLERGCEVCVTCLDRNRADELLEAVDIRLDCFEYDNRSLSPFKMSAYRRHIKDLILDYKPGLILTFQAKPNIVGCQAAAKAHTDATVISMVEGLGDPFIKTGLKWRLIRLIESVLYKRALKRSDLVFFLNQDNCDAFLASRIIPKEKARVQSGIGIALSSFQSSPVENPNAFLFIGRLLRSKGVLVFCEAARTVRKSHPDSKFIVAGIEFDVTRKDLEPFIAEGIIDYRGACDNPPDLYREAGTVVAPSSYGEGFSVVAMEAAASGRAIITSNITGCRDAVIGGVTGILVNPGDMNGLVSAMNRLLERPDLVRSMGESGRKHAEEEFDFPQANKLYLSELQSRLGEAAEE